VKVDILMKHMHIEFNNYISDFVSQKNAEMEMIRHKWVPSQSQTLMRAGERSSVGLVKQEIQDSFFVFFLQLQCEWYTLLIAGSPP